jgi:cell wall-associated NlpC family hydrolase
MRSRLLPILLVLALAALALAKGVRPAGASSAATLSLAAKRAKVVRYARRYLGVRYRYGGASPRTGFDCSGFVAFVYGHFGVALPHYSVAQFGLGRRVPRGSLRPGDLVFFDGLGHVGIYVGKGRFIHAPHSGTRVSIDPIAGWYGARYDGARRLRIAVAR